MGTAADEQVLTSTTHDPTASGEPAPGALVIGEAIVDIVGQDGTQHEFIGGSPANIALGLGRLGHPTRLLTLLGRDPRGERIVAHLAEDGVETLPESWSPHPTPTAHARIAADGSASYVFDIRWEVAELPIPEVALVHSGSIALFLEPGGREVLRMLAEASRRAVVTLDPNVRPDLLPEHPVALRRFEEAARTADLVKLSDEDASWLYPGLPHESVAELVRGLGPRVVVVTLGEQGALAICDGGPHGASPLRVAARPAAVVDTISAGDSFMASLASSLLELGLDGVAEMLPRVLDRAARAASIAVSAAGPNPPRREELEDGEAADGENG